MPSSPLGPPLGYWGMLPWSLIPLAAAGVERMHDYGTKLSFHSLRTTAGCTWAERKPMAKVSRLMRHTILTTTQRLYMQYGLFELFDEDDFMELLTGTEG
jgi:integrase